MPVPSGTPLPAYFVIEALYREPAALRSLVGLPPRVSGLGLALRDRFRIVIVNRGPEEAAMRLFPPRRLTSAVLSRLGRRGWEARPHDPARVLSLEPFEVVEVTAG
jgi:hypothetical protein